MDELDIDLTVVENLRVPSGPGVTGGGLVIRNAVIFDGRDRIAADAVRVEAGLIVDVGRGVRGRAASAEVDAGGGTLLPGLIDAHAHVGGRTALARAVRFGVTTVCDQAMDPQLAARLKADDLAGRAGDVASLLSAGTLVTAPGGHGSRQLVGPIPTLSRAEEADGFVADRIDEGSDWIKVVHDDFSAFAQDLPTLDEPTTRAVVAAAHCRNRLVVAHIGRLAGARAAVACGVDILGHWVADQLPDDQLVADMAARGTTVIPTLCMLASICGQPHLDLASDPALSPYLSERDRTDLARSIGPADNPAVNLEVAYAGVAALARAGVVLLAGTDAPFPGMTHGVSLHGELEALTAAGLTPSAALAAATSAPGQCFGLADRGVIAPGRRADLVLVAGDPLEDIRASRAITRVWRGGQPIERHPEKRTGYPRLPVPPAGLLAARDGDRVAAPSTSRWTVLTDQVIGGHSTAEVCTVSDADAPDGWAIEVAGHLDGMGWAGLAFYPNPIAGAADLSGWRGITIWTHVDRRFPQLVAMLATHSRGRASPPTKRLDDHEGWLAQQLAWNEFDRSDGHDIRFAAILAGGHPGPFRFRLARPQADIRREAT